MDRCRLPWSRRLPSRCLEGRCKIKHQLMLETSYLVMETHANSTLSKCMLLACAYQSARQRSMGIAEKTCEGFWRLFGKGRLFGRPLFLNKSSGTINPVYLPRKLLNNTKNVSINKTLSITTLAQYVYPATWEDHPMNNHEQLWPWSCSVFENWEDMLNDATKMLLFALLSIQKSTSTKSTSDNTCSSGRHASLRSCLTQTALVCWGCSLLPRRGLGNTL